MKEAAPVQELNAGVHQGLPEIRGWESVVTRPQDKPPHPPVPESVADRSGRQGPSAPSADHQALPWRGVLIELRRWGSSKQGRLRIGDSSQGEPQSSGCQQSP